MIGRLLKRRMPAYLGGLLLSLGAMVMIFQAKKAFAPKFHEVRFEAPPALLGPGGSIKIIYTDDPGYSLPPGFPSKLVVSHKAAPGSSASPVMQLAYRHLVDKAAVVGPLEKEGEFRVQGELYVCDSPGVADCAKLLVTQEVSVRAGAPREAALALDLKSIGRQGLEAAMPVAPR